MILWHFRLAVLAVLDLVLRDPDGTLPGALLRDRMALNAAVACLRLEGRRESASEIRDAVCLARAGDLRDEVHCSVWVINRVLWAESIRRGNA